MQPNIIILHKIELNNDVWCPLELQSSNFEKRKVALNCARFLLTCAEKSKFEKISEIIEKKDFFRKNLGDLQFSHFEKIKVLLNCIRLMLI